MKLIPISKISTIGTIVIRIPKNTPKLSGLPDGAAGKITPRIKRVSGNKV